MQSQQVMTTVTETTLACKLSILLNITATM